MRSLVLGLKFAHERSNAIELAAIVLGVVPSLGIRSATVTWAPTTTRHRHERGMDHAEQIARHVAAGSGLPCRKLLRRVDSRSQTGLGRLERQSGPKFVARPLRKPSTVIVIDDVVTTGATFTAAARALVESGATEVVCIAPSRTP